MPKIKKTQLRSIKGMHDILPEEQIYWDLILKKGRGILEDYGFRKLDTPVVEFTALYNKSTGENSDIVEKEMYTFRTRGKDQISLRPEFSPGVARAYIEHGMHVRPHPVQLWSFGPLFRHDRPQYGRYRQLHQLNAELFGDESAASDAMMIFISYKIFESIGFKNIIIKINTIGDSSCRPQYIKALKDHYRYNKKSCVQCQKRLKTTPLRVLDCKNEQCMEIAKEAPQFLDHLDDDCKKHFKTVLEFLDEIDIPYLLDHTLVRGMDYYTRTVFEAFIEIDKKKDKENDEKEDDKDSIEKIALGGGGRYDKLVEFLSGPKTPATGWALGIERIILAMKKFGIEPPSSRVQPKVFIAQLGELAKRKSLKLFEDFRRSGLTTKASFGRDSIKAQLRVANRLNIPYTIIMGQKEALDGSVIIREMDTGVQETIPADKVIEMVKQKLKK